MKKVKPQNDLIDALSLADLCRFCQADEAWVIELVDYGVIEPKGSIRQNWHFHGTTIARAKRASRLMRDLGVNVAGIALVLDLLDERDAMLRKLAQQGSGSG